MHTVTDNRRIPGRLGLEEESRRPCLIAITQTSSTSDTLLRHDVKLPNLPTMSLGINYLSLRIVHKEV